MMIAALNDLPSKYDIIRTVLVAHDTSLSFKDFHNQLLADEQVAEARVFSSHAPMVGMLSQSSPSVSSHAFSFSGHGDGLLPTPPMPHTTYMSSQLSLVVVLFLSVRSAASEVTSQSIAIFEIRIPLLTGPLPQLNVRFVAKRAMRL
ncbi:unnamed protein product [Prunus armeniaca]